MNAVSLFSMLQMCIIRLKFAAELKEVGGVKR